MPCVGQTTLRINFRRTYEYTGVRSKCLTSSSHHSKNTGHEIDLENRLGKK